MSQLRKHGLFWMLVGVVCSVSATVRAGTVMADIDTGFKFAGLGAGTTTLYAHSNQTKPFARGPNASSYFNSISGSVENKTDDIPEAKGATISISRGFLRGSNTYAPAVGVIDRPKPANGVSIENLVSTSGSFLGMASITPARGDDKGHVSAKGGILGVDPRFAGTAAGSATDPFSVAPGTYPYSQTIDASLQMAVEQELLAAWIADRAKRVSAVVIDPYSGEIYAYASYPSYNENDYQQIANVDPGRFVDPIVSTVYEPGSVFKLMTATAAIGSGAVKPTTQFNDPGHLSLDHGVNHVYDADKQPMPRMTFAKGIAFSRNVVAAQVALRLGRTTARAARVLYNSWITMGFGQKTGIDVANEVDGIVHDPATTPWQQIDLANGSFGQGMAVTPIQLAQAYSAMLNGGTLVQPRVVKSIGNQDTPPVSKGRVMTAALSRTLTKIMKSVISTVPFYRNRTLIPGFEVGGKTGTAQIWDPAKNDWKVNLFNYSFVGYIARTPGHPDLVVAVRIEEGTPTVVRQGHLEMPVMSFELFRRIAHDAITTPYLVPETQSVPPPTQAAP